MNTQVLIPLDDMTAENGATSLRPKSHLEIEYPSDVKEYRSKWRRNEITNSVQEKNDLTISSLATDSMLLLCFLLWPELIWRSWKESVGQGWGCGYFRRPGAALRHAKLQSRLEVRHTNTISSEVGQTNGGSKGNVKTWGRSQTLRVK